MENNYPKARSQRERKQPGMDPTGLTSEDNINLFPPAFQKRPALRKKFVPWVWVGGPTKPVRDDTPWAEADKIRRSNRIADPWLELTKDREGMDLVRSVQRTQADALSTREKRFKKLVEFALSPEDETGKTDVKNNVSAAALKRSGAPATSRRGSAQAPLLVREEVCRWDRGLF